ncbi:hypothetical protein GMA3_59 [Gordonia phage GMA3]|uniref:Uncharacterized protein n=1 Tax=Gordonia phage GMA3 TaxID=1647284 RepID=A0A0K0NKK6_9CAUD|nr:hypothetical protein AU105_gp059 [Gordonia phage GMA3]AKL88236.1 hypothetical protein GMA3_59 [Gordonia phage GMA3]
MSDEPFFFNPNDPSSFDKLEAHLKNDYERNVYNQMRNTAATNEMWAWIENLEIRDLAMLYFILMRINPSGWQDSGSDSVMLMVQNLISQTSGAIEVRARQQGVALDGPQMINIILGTGVIDTEEK